jgi:hypothetical protein
MAIITDASEAWTFAGLSLPRTVDGASWADWFTEEAILAIDPILDSDERYTDNGGATFPPLTIRAAFNTKTERDLIRSKRGLTATLTNIAGDSRSATLKTIAPISSSAGLFYADLTFEAA